MSRPLLTMRSFRQPVAARGNGFGLFPWLPRHTDLPLIATGCNHGAPHRLHPALSARATHTTCRASPCACSFWDLHRRWERQRERCGEMPAAYY